MVAVPELEVIPYGIRMWVKGMVRELDVVVKGWIEEPVPFIQPLDTTPTGEYFEQVRCDNLKAVVQHNKELGMAEMVAVYFEMIFGMWVKMEKGRDKEKLENILKSSPYYAVREKELLLQNLAGGSRSVQGTPEPTSEVNIEGSSGQRKTQDRSSKQKTGGRLTKEDYLNSWRRPSKLGKSATLDRTEGTHKRVGMNLGIGDSGSRPTTDPQPKPADPKGKGTHNPEPAKKLTWAEQVEQEEQNWALSQIAPLVVINGEEKETSPIVNTVQESEP